MKQIVIVIIVIIFFIEINFMSWALLLFEEHYSLKAIYYKGCNRQKAYISKNRAILNLSMIKRAGLFLVIKRVGLKLCRNR